MSTAANRHRGGSCRAGWRSTTTSRSSWCAVRAVTSGTRTATATSTSSAASSRRSSATPSPRSSRPSASRPARCCTRRRCISASRWSSSPSGWRRCRASPTRRCSSPRRAPKPTRPRCSRRRRYRRSNQVLALRNSYHGRSFGTIAITGNRSWSPTSLSGLQVSFVHGGYRLRSPFRELDDDAYTAACVQDLRDVIDMCTTGDVACMIAEPIQGVGGFATPPDGFFGAMEKVLADTASCSSATRCRPASVAPATTSGATKRTASCPTSSPSRRESATG